MTSSIFIPLDRFALADAPHQLALLSDFVLTTELIDDGSKAQFDQRLGVYSRKASISMEQARHNVCIDAHNKFNKRLQALDCDVE